MNPADLMTKYLGRDCIRGHLQRMFLVPTSSRLANALVLFSIGEFHHIRMLTGQINCIACNNDFPAISCLYSRVLGRVGMPAP